MALHEQSVGKSDEWYTPEYVFKAMATRFDLDVCAPRSECPAYDWCDDAHTQDSLSREWWGCVWMNPPFGKRNGIVPWLEKFVAHGCGVALTPDRTSCPWWQDFSKRSDLVLFVAPKIHFIPGVGVDASSPAQGTSLFALGERSQFALRQAAVNGLGVLFSPVR
jgi:hypothetical protein